MAPIEIHRQMVEVYGPVMSVQCVRKWCREFRRGRTNVENKQRSDGPSVISDALHDVRKIEKKFCDPIVRLTISDLLDQFPSTSRGAICIPSCIKD